MDNDDTVNLKVNETEQIIVKIKDQDKTEKAKFEIVGEDKDIASVSDTGLITALNEGVTKVKVHLDDTEEDVEITVIVYNPALHTLLYSSNDIPTQTIEGTKYMIMYEGETGHIKISIAGEDKTTEGEYSVNPTGIITIENTEQNPGLITAIKKGDTVLTLEHDVATEGPVDVNVKVMESPQLITTNLNIIQGYTGQIVIKNLSGEDITNKFSFTSTNNNIATVDTNGKVTLKQGQNTTITATYNDGIRPFSYTINVTAQKTLTNTGLGVNATALTYDETQQIITILMDTGMISNENDVDNIVKIDKTNGQETITITIDRPNGTQVAVVAYENGEIKYISTGEVENNQVTVDVQHSNQNIVAQTDSNGTVTSTVVTPGFYDSNNNLLYDWNTVVGWGWNFSKDYNFWDATSQTGHFYKILAAHGDLKNATKLVIPERVSKMGNCCFYNCTISLDTIVFPNDYTYEAIGSTVHMIQANLQNYTIRSDNPHFDSINGIVYSEDHKRLLVCPKNKTNIRVLDGTTYISGQAFEKNISKSVGPYDSGAEIEFPNTVETFNWSVFHSMPYLRWAELWNGFKYSYGDPFVNCANLESLYIPSSVITIQRVSNGQEMVNIVCYCPKVKIYCEPTSKPSGWANYWNAKTPNNSPLADTYWGVSRETYRANNRYLNN